MVGFAIALPTLHIYISRSQRLRWECIQQRSALRFAPQT
jgi:hypothetical protein